MTLNTRNARYPARDIEACKLQKYIIGDTNKCIKLFSVEQLFENRKQKANTNTRNVQERADETSDIAEVTRE